MSKRLKVFFSISLLLNLIFIGSIIGIAARWQWGDGYRFTPQAMRTSVFEHILEDISDAEKRTELHQKFATLQTQNRAHEETIRNSRRLVRGLLDSKPFDDAAYGTAITALLAAKRDTELSYALLLSEVMKALPVDERDDVAKWLYKGDIVAGKRRHKKHKDHGDHN